FRSERREPLAPRGLCPASRVVELILAARNLAVLHIVDLRGARRGLQEGVPLACEFNPAICCRQHTADDQDLLIGRPPAVIEEDLKNHEKPTLPLAGRQAGNLSTNPLSRRCAT